jgi:hypothetical protein
MNRTMLGELEAAQGRVQINQAARAFPGSAIYKVVGVVKTHVWF